MEVQAITRNVGMSAQKMREVVRQIQGLPAPHAQAVLAVVPRKSARLVAKTLKSAVANAENNFNMDPDELVIMRCAADEGRTLKRWRPRARGRVNQILKRSSHITVVVAEKGA